jgi:hypothetical protein
MWKDVLTLRVQGHAVPEKGRAESRHIEIVANCVTQAPPSSMLSERILILQRKSSRAGQAHDVPDTR